MGYIEQFSLPAAQLRIDRASQKVLVVIPCLNESAHIARRIAEIVGNPQLIDPLIVVADGGSTDGTREIVSEIARSNRFVRLLLNPRKLQSAGINLAVRHFGRGCRWLVRIDAHAEYPENYIPALIEEAERTGAASVVVSMKSQGDGEFQYAAATVQNSILGAGGSAHRRQGKAEFVDHGHHALFDLARFRAIGGYDETLSHNEDAELDVRLARAGGKIWLTRSVEIVYFPRSNPTALFRQYFNYGRGRAVTLLRHKLRPKLRQMAPACVLPALLTLAASPWLHVAVGPALLWALACIVLGSLLGIHKGILCALSVGLAAMIIHLGWSAGFWSGILQHNGPRRVRTAPLVSSPAAHGR